MSEMNTYTHRLKEAVTKHKKQVEERLRVGHLKKGIRVLFIEPRQG